MANVTDSEFWSPFTYFRPSASPRLQKNGAVLDFSRGPVTSPPSMISPLTTRKQRNSNSDATPGPAGDSPLDLSVSHKKSSDDEGPVKKLPKWSPPMEQPLVLNHSHPRDRKNSWNGTQSPDIKALEKMSEMTSPKLVSPSSRGNSGSSSAWQAQWLAQNSSGNREIFKCVVCRATFNTLAALSVHMKESKHGPPMPNIPSPKIPPQQSPVSTPTGSSASNDSLLLKG